MPECQECKYFWPIGEITWFLTAGLPLDDYAKQMLGKSENPPTVGTCHRFPPRTASISPDFTAISHQLGELAIARVKRKAFSIFALRRLVSEPETLADLADRYGMTPEQVRQHEVDVFEILNRESNGGLSKLFGYGDQSQWFPTVSPRSWCGEFVALKQTQEIEDMYSPTYSA